MFHPPFCPNRRCPEHRDPTRRFFVRKGSYPVRCRPKPVPRFRCKRCGLWFSRQTFRMDYCDHKPYLNAPLFKLLASGVGLRQSARVLRLSNRCTELKARKIGRHLRRLNRRVLSELGPTARLHFDEIETYEGQRNTRPLTVPVLVESESRFILWSESNTIRPSGKMSDKRKEAIERSEQRFGPRVDRSRVAILRTLKRGADAARRSERVVLHSDEKQLYPLLSRVSFGRSIDHRRTNSQVARTTWNPLFPINHEEALMRDLMGRLRRDSWLVSKQRRYLDIALHVHIAYRNLVRNRFNADERTPAQILGWMPRRLSLGEVLGWRQERGKESSHPISKPSGRFSALGRQRAA